MPPHGAVLQGVALVRQAAFATAADAGAVVADLHATGPAALDNQGAGAAFWRG